MAISAGMKIRTSTESQAETQVETQAEAEVDTQAEAEVDTQAEVEVDTQSCESDCIKQYSVNKIKFRLKFIKILQHFIY